jgi:tripartite-type tricarboxylate transporter receptor subunit TctC
MTLDRRAIARMGLALPLVALSGRIRAQSSFPTQGIRMIVAFGPGTGSDIIARVLAPAMSKILGVPIIVENRVGAGGVIGTEAVARATPDGYTLSLGTTSSFGTTPILNPTAKYSFEKDFAPVAGLAKTDYVIVTGATPDAPKTLQELLTRIRTTPAAFGSAGLGTITHLATEVLLQRAQVKATHVPYSGSGQVVASVAGGQVLFATDSPAATLGLIKGGKLRALATTGRERMSATPEVPTLSEAGFPGLVIIAWWGLAAPAGTAPDVVKRLGDAAFKAMQTPEIRDRLRGMEIDPMLMQPGEFTAFIRQDMPFWVSFLRDAKITLAP